MSGKKLRLLILTHGGDKAEKIIEHVLALPCAEVGSIFVETVMTRRRGRAEKLRRSLRYDGFGGTLAKGAKKLLARFGRGTQMATQPAALSHERLREVASAYGAPLHFVADFHSPESRAKMRAVGADLGVVLGTNILRKEVFSIPRLGSINLHQGLAPYYRGGPAVFWELFNGEVEVGVTVHFVAAAVDAGDIIAQETLPLAYDYGYELRYEAFIDEYRDRLTDCSARLVPQAIQMLAEGTADPRPQETWLGKRYRLPVKKEKDELRRRLRERLGSAGLAAGREAKAGVRNG